MKEKKLKLMKYLLFGVFTCLIGVGFTGCGEDYDDEIKDLQSKLAKVTTDLGLAATTTAMNTAVAGVVEQAKTAAKEEVAKMMGSGVTVEQASKSMGELMALNAYFANDPYFAGATRTLNEVLGEAATKAGTTSVMVEGMKKLATDVAMLKNQMAVLGTVTGTGSNAQSSVIKDIQDRLDAISTGTGGGTPNYDAIAAALAANQAFMNAIIEKIGGDLNMLPVYNMITEISLVQTASGVSFLPLTLSFGTTLSNANAYGWFGPDNYAGRFEFKKDVFLSSTQRVVVRVTPANVQLTKEMISLVNSKGESNAGNKVRVVDVKKYEDAITRATSVATGLYEIIFDLTGDIDTGDNALAVAAQANTGRHVLTDFAIKLTDVPNGISPVSVLEFSVKGQPIGTIAGLNGTSTAERNPNLTNLPVKVGEAFEVKMDATPMKSAYAYYIDVEKLNPTDADRSKITGLQKVYRIDETAKLTITDAAMKGTQQKFRVHAVNYDGTRTVVGGKSFYVICDKDMTQGGTLNFVTENPAIMMSVNDRLSTKAVDIPYWTAQTDPLIKYFDMTMTVEGFKFTMSGQYTPSGSTTSVGNVNNSMIATSLSDDKRCITIGGINPANFREDVVYSGTLTLRDATQAPLATYPVTLKKPTPSVPAILMQQPANLGTGAYITANGKLITAIPTPSFDGANGPLNKALFPQSALESWFSDARIIIEPAISNGIENKSGTLNLSNGYYNTTPSNLIIKYKFGYFGYSGIGSADMKAEEYSLIVPGYQIQYASALTGYKLGIQSIEKTEFIVGDNLTLTTALTLTSFMSGASLPLNKDLINQWIDPALNSLNVTMTYLNDSAGYQSITLTHVGYDSNTGSPKFTMSSSAVKDLAFFKDGRLCGFNMTFTDRLGAKSIVKGNMTIKIVVNAAGTPVITVN